MVGKYKGNMINMSFRTFALLTILVILFLTTGFSLVSANEKVFCQAWANPPYAIRTTAYGTGGVNCSTTVYKIKVVTEIVDITNGTSETETESCYNTDYCESTAYKGLNSGHTYQTKTSGYAGTWNGYYESSTKVLP